MSRKHVAAFAALVLLAGCATAGNFHQQSQKAEATGEYLYVATVHSLDGLLAAKMISQETHDQDWRGAWTALQDVRTQYNLGFAVNLAVLQAKAKVAGVPQTVIDGAK